MYRYKPLSNYKGDHIRGMFTPENIPGSWNVSIFQSAADEICISLENIRYNPLSRSMILFNIPIKTAAGYAIKINKKSISCNSGNAADIIRFLKSFTGENFIGKILQRVIFDDPKKRATPGL